MVARQLARRGIHDHRVLEVMGSLPREAFVPGVSASVAYDDRALPIDAGQTISQPYMVARMTELLEIEPGDRILEIGTGSGYQAAVLARLGARVTSIERHAALSEAAGQRLASVGIDVALGVGVGVDAGVSAEASASASGVGGRTSTGVGVGVEASASAESSASAGVAGGRTSIGADVELRVGDGSRGDPEGAPWDGIVVTAAAPSIAQELREQLGIGARLVIPVGQRERQELIVIERRGPNDWQEWSDGAVVFVPLVGEAGWPT
jgi:protein-L-isoaspartate(D-aspartate) O-methyltransferase